MSLVVGAAAGDKHGFKRAQEMDREHMRTSILRQKRMEKLEALNDEQDGVQVWGVGEYCGLWLLQVPRVPDGVALTSGAEMLAIAMAGATGEAGEGPTAPRVLNVPQKCYTCKVPFREFNGCTHPPNVLTVRWLQVSYTLSMTSSAQIALS